MNEKSMKVRSIITLSLIFAVFLVFGGVLLRTQIIEGSEYAEAGSALTSKTVVIKAARGEILDRNGNPLVINRQGNSIVFRSVYFPTLDEQEKRNEIIISLISLFEKQGEKWNDTLPIVLDSSGKPAFAEKRESDITMMKSKDMLNLNDYATAANCMDTLIKKYKLESYPLADARKIASVCYELTRISFNLSNPYTFAEDVSTELVAKIKENSDFYRGVEVEIVPYREYVDGTVAPHILGMVGAINAEEYAEKKDEGYALNDTIGKNGIEGAMEDYLRGTDGLKIVTVGNDGDVSEKIVSEPVQGGTAILTIDKNLQEVTQNALKNFLLSADTPVSPGGAAIVLKVNTGEVLACATYPTYDIAKYSKTAKLDNETNSPLWNRALLSSYAPGSTAKPSVAIGVLEEGIIDDNTTVYCSGIYKYLDMQFKCEQDHDTRHLNVVAAIDESCNTFFYEMGKRLGITKLNEYRTLLGLGQKTGCELSEAAGVLDSPEYRETLSQEWNPGYAIQSAIGQAGNLFTPIQLANYCATIANGGTRYKTHFVRSVKSYDYTSTVLDKTPVVACETGFSKKTLDLVREGMRRVGTTGYCRYYFKDLPVVAAAKTGTSQVIKTVGGTAQKINNGFLITFAPFEDPEIAICLVGEGFTSGTQVAPIAAEIYTYYFTEMETVAKAQQENTLLS